jgi:hypothetical protein
MEYITKPIYKYLSILFVVFLFILNQEIFDNYVDIFIISFSITFIMYLFDNVFILNNLGIYDEPQELLILEKKYVVDSRYRYRYNDRYSDSDSDTYSDDY